MKVRVLRVIQYEGEREWVEAQVSRSIHGRIVLPNGTITVATLNEFPQALDEAPRDEARNAIQDLSSLGGRRG